MYNKIKIKGGTFSMARPKKIKTEEKVIASAAKEEKKTAAKKTAAKKTAKKTAAKKTAAKKTTAKKTTTKKTTAKKDK